MANVLVLANETIGGKNLLDRIREKAAGDDGKPPGALPAALPDPSKTIRELVKETGKQVGAELTVKRFARFQMGEE